MRWENGESEVHPILMDAWSSILEGEEEALHRIAADDNIYLENQKNARKITIKAIRTGEIKRPDICQNCGEICKRMNSHHADYLKPLDIVWLCHACHRKIHPGKRRRNKKVLEKVKGRSD